MLNKIEVTNYILSKIHSNRATETGWGYGLVGAGFVFLMIGLDCLSNPRNEVYILNKCSEQSRQNAETNMEEG